MDVCWCIRWRRKRHIFPFSIGFGGGEVLLLFDRQVISSVGKSVCQTRPTYSLQVTMLSLLLLLLLLPRSTLATPPSPPKITQLVFSGNGCPVNSNSVKASTAYLGDSAGFSFTMLDGEATKNCEIHVQSSGGSQGWQVAIGEIVYEGDVWLKGQSAIQTVTQVYWSEDAGNTVSCCCCCSFFILWIWLGKKKTIQFTGADIFLLCLGGLDRRSYMHRVGDQGLRFVEQQHD